MPPIQPFTIQATDVTPVQRAAVNTVATANPDTFTTDVDGYDGPLEGYTENVTLTMTFPEPWSEAKTTAASAVLAALD